MRKKLLAVVLSTTMIVTSLTACGKDNSSYFGELKKTTGIETGTTTTEISFSGKIDDLDGSYKQLVDSKGNVDVTLKIDAENESISKNAAKLSVKYGTQSEYSEISTIVVDDDMLYVNVKPAVDLVAKFNEQISDTMTTTLASIGIKDYVSIKMSTIIDILEKASGEKVGLSKSDYKDDAVKFVNDVCDILAKDFADISGKDGSDYTLTFNKDNAQKAAECVGKFVKNDSETVYDGFIEFAKAMYGEDSDNVKEIVDNKEDALKKLKESLDKVAENKEEYIKSVEENEISVLSKVKVDGKEGSRNCKFSLDASMNGKEIIGNDSTYKVSVKGETKEGKVSIDDRIPKDAMDVTLLLTAGISKYLPSQDIGSDDDTDISDDTNEETDIESGDLNENTSDNTYKGNYSFTLEGKNIDLPCDVEELKKNGFELSTDTEEIEAGDYISTTISSESGKMYVIYIKNDTTYKIPAEDGVVCGISIDDNAEFTTSDNFTIGTDIAAVKDKLGEATTYFKNGDEENYSWYENTEGINGVTMVAKNGKVTHIELLTGTK